MAETATVLEMTHISKSFPGVRALEDVSLALAAGEVLAVVGENGAGKSTLIKILSGVYSTDTGEISLQGRRVALRGPKDAMDRGINTIYQETSLVQDITVAENIFLGRQPSVGGRIDWKRMMDSARGVLERLSITLSPAALISSLSSAQQQLVEIAKAFSRDAKIIIMDEPTASITVEDAENLFGTIRKITRAGTAVIYISHRLKEIFQVADRVMVLRDGKTVTVSGVRETTEGEIVKNMVGRDIGNLFGEASYAAGREDRAGGEEPHPQGRLPRHQLPAPRGGDPRALGPGGRGPQRDRARHLRAGRGGRRRGPPGGERLALGNPAAALKRGIAFVSEDRRLESIIQGFTVRANMTILLLAQVLSRLGLINGRKESALAARYVKEFNVKTPSLEQLVMNLSGGNQQKVALAKCLSTDPRVLILDEPTKGIDVGAKKEIHTLIKELANRGVAILLVSSELPEIIGMCHRAAVIREGALVRLLRQGRTGRGEADRSGGRPRGVREGPWLT